MNKNQHLLEIGFTGRCIASIFVVLKPRHQFDRSGKGKSIGFVGKRKSKPLACILA